MNWLEQLHNRYIMERRLCVLSRSIAAICPESVSILDVGCGSGRLASRILERRPDLPIRGIDILPPEADGSNIQKFDGKTIPFADRSFDMAMFVDVLHHAEDPEALLREGIRVARKWILIKDHLREGPAAQWRLELMDRVGNRRFGVAMTYRYWRRPEWEDLLAREHLNPVSWSETLHLYPPPLDWIFGGSLHFLALLAVPISVENSN